VGNIAEYIYSLHVDSNLRVSCPVCSSDRKKSNVKDFNIDRKEDIFIFHCHHCQVGGAIPTEKRERKVQPLRQQITTVTELQ
jgi:hypothetical protein